MSNNLEKKESLSKIKVLYFIFNLLPLIALGFGITFTIVNGVVYNWHKTILIICIIISILVIAVSIAIVGAVRMIVYRKEHGMTKDVVKQQERNQKKYEKMFAEQEAEKKKNEKTKEQLEEEAKYDEVIVENKNEDVEVDKITQEAISKINDTNSAPAPSPIEFKAVELNNKNN